jgi:hypothetical protein
MRARDMKGEEQFPDDRGTIERMECKKNWAKKIIRSKQGKNMDRSQEID